MSGNANLAEAPPVTKMQKDHGVEESEGIMVADKEMEGRLVWKDQDSRDGKMKLHAYYYVDKEGRKEAIKYAQRRTYDFEEHRAEADPNNLDSLVYRKV